MRVVLDEESIQVEGNYYPLPVGNIYIEDYEGAFPSDDYSDFVSVLLLWWTNELINFYWGAKTVKLRFMDEHYYIHLIHDGADDLEWCQANFGESTLQGVELTREVEFDLPQFTNSLAQAVNTLLRNQTFVEKMPEEAAELQLAYGRLRQLLKKK